MGEEEEGETKRFEKRTEKEKKEEKKEENETVSASSFERVDRK